jgi:hypothetical protein
VSIAACSHVSYSNISESALEFLEDIHPRIRRENDDDDADAWRDSSTRAHHVLAVTSLSPSLSLFLYPVCYPSCWLLPSLNPMSFGRGKSKRKREEAFYTRHAR